MSILHTIAAASKIRAEKEKQKKRPTPCPTHLPPFAFEKALQSPTISFICEIKKASPSKGIIAQDFSYIDIAKAYQAAGANAISILTEPHFFKGADHYLTAIRQTVNLPLLRKDFIVDSFQIEQAKMIGADAILLIVSILTPKQLRDFLHQADTLGLSALVEVHDETELKIALQAGSRIIGVNNRNLNDFSVDTNNSLLLRKLVPPEILFVSESGIRTAADVQLLQNCGTQAVLIGETLMRAQDKAAALSALRATQ